MIQRIDTELKTDENDFGFLHASHTYQDVRLQVISENPDLTRPADSDLTPEDQAEIEGLVFEGVITLTVDPNAGVALSDIRIQLDIDELERSRDYDIVLVDPDTGQLTLDGERLQPGGEPITCQYAWSIKNVFGEIGEDFSVVFSIRPSYTVTMLAVERGPQRDPSKDIGEATVSVSP